MSATGRKRPAPPATSAKAQPPPPKQQAMMEEEDMDEDIFMDETLMQIDEEYSQRHEMAKWKRPPLSDSYLNLSQNVVFQQLEIDYVIGDSHKKLLPGSSGPAAILRIYGVTREGHSVCCHVHGFEPYFYISCPRGMGPDDISSFHKILEDMMRQANQNSRTPKCVLRVECVNRRSIMHYQQENSQPFLKIVVALPTMVTKCRSILEKGIHIDGLGMRSFLTYESNVLFALRFMIDCNIVGGNWIEVPRGKYEKTARNHSYCQLEFDCLYPHIWKVYNI